MAITQVQSTSINGGANYLNTQAITFTSNTTTGNFLVAAISFSGANTVTGVTDSVGNTWVRAAGGSNATNPSTSELWYVANATGGTTPTVTVNYSAYVQEGVMLSEYSGVSTTATVDATNLTNFDTYTTTFTSTALTTTNANDLIVSMFTGNDGSTVFSSNDASYTGLAQTGNGAGNYVAGATQYKAVTTTGSYTNSFTSTASIVGPMVTVAFNAGASGPAAPVASFTSSAINSMVSTSISFTDTSSNTPTSWSWNFGDSTTSTLQNPSHTYTAAGTYTVALTATNSTGSNTDTKTNYITIYATPPGASGQANWYTYGYPAVADFTTRTNYLKDAWNVFKGYTFSQTGMVTAMPAGAWRVIVPDQTDSNGNANYTNSEGMGYGMIAAVYMGMPTSPVYDSTAKSYFDGFWTYVNYYKDANGLMNWRIDYTGTIIGSGSATDGDLDIAFALVMADKVWGSTGAINYAAEAQAYINAIKAHDFYPSTQTGGLAYLMINGDGWDSSFSGSPDWTMPDYYAPAYMGEFATYMNDSWWTSALAANQKLAVDYWVQHYSDGFVPDNATREGGVESGQSYLYGYNAIRRFRITLDFLWNGGGTNPYTYYLNKNMASFINTTSAGSATATNSSWAIDGSSSTAGGLVAFNQSYAVASLVDSSLSSFGNTLYSWIDTTNTSTATSYFQGGLAVMSALVASGLMQPTYTPPPATTNTGQFFAFF